MAKFVIECPNCGRYAEASSGVLGFFATKKINCSCGHVIDVKTEKIASKVCAHCGNTVIYDQSKGEDAVCPVCHEKINTRESMASLVEFSCPSCSCRLSADKNAEKYTCPLCETEIDVQKQIKKEAVKNQGLASVIKYEGGNDVFVWKHPIEDFNLGSQLIVHESQEAVFFRDGQALDLFGAGRYTLPTQNIPVLESIYKLPSGTADVFHSEVYFVNLTTQMGIKWGTPSKVSLFDPASGFHVEIGASGELSLKVADSRKLVLKLVGTANSFTQNEFAGKDVEIDGITYNLVIGKFKPLIVSAVKNNLAKIIKSKGIAILELDENVDVLSEAMRVAINGTLEEYGLYMPEFFITSFSYPTDKDFEIYKKQFGKQTILVREENIRKAEAEAAQARKLVEAQTEAQIKIMNIQGEAEALKIKAQAEADAYRAQAFAEADEMRAKGYTYAQETSRQVGMQAMKNGITGGGSAAGGNSVIGDIAGLGVTLGAMGGVVDMAKEALSPMFQSAASVGNNALPKEEKPQADTWDCECGKKGIISKFCPECGAKKPEPKETWDCACGKKGITSKFCPECGAKKPEPPATWDCECGKKGITSKFCPECGAKKPEAAAEWICPNCGMKGIKGKFCPECGTKKES